MSSSDTAPNAEIEQLQARDAIREHGATEYARRRDQ